ncbi:hypothetical protein [Acidocella sp. MX-AZ02]|uniref:hypothetical protein n=1 Tax=Acidocella sp. MX-AZ02 TaxID=1214225 RepID=UPI0011817EBE|nr:hypothetical protein [Acidocella sp. MX-AZ02]
MIKFMFAASLALLAANCHPVMAQPLTSPNQDATSTTTKVPHPETTKSPMKCGKLESLRMRRRPPAGWIPALQMA